MEETLSRTISVANGGLKGGIRQGQVDRPIWQYLEKHVNDFHVDSSFGRGGVFVASGVKR